MHRPALATEPKPGACHVSGTQPELLSSEKTYILDVWPKLGLVDMGSPRMALFMEVQVSLAPRERVISCSHRLVQPFASDL